ncbi:MAG: hypothetical protein KJO84_00070, partial [Acidimicrobiia bacterium]|nr:hypothetical protein [Acidimicrobiia bacterium]
MTPSTMVIASSSSHRHSKRASSATATDGGTDVAVGSSDGAMTAVCPFHEARKRPVSMSTASPSRRSAQIHPDPARDCHRRRSRIARANESWRSRRVAASSYLSAAA